MNVNAIVIMAREPVSGKVKTRLALDISSDIAAKLYSAFLLDRLAQVNRIHEADHFVAFTPETSLNYFEGIIPSDFYLIAQVGDDLGERLDNVSSYLFNNGYEKVVMMDSDSPNLPTTYIQQGLEKLDNADITIGPCEDGGYYLIGFKERLPEIFENVPWSTPDVTKITVRKALDLGKEIITLDQWYDIDTMEDLERLKRDLDAANYDSKKVDFCENTINELKRVL